MTEQLKTLIEEIEFEIMMKEEEVANHNQAIKLAKTDIKSLKLKAKKLQSMIKEDK